MSADGEEAAGGEKSYQQLIANMNSIAQPLASKKLSKKLYKCVKKGEMKCFCAGKNQTPLEKTKSVTLPHVSGCYDAFRSLNEIFYG